MKKIVTAFKKITPWFSKPELYYTYLGIVFLASLVLLISHFTTQILILEMSISFLPLATILQTGALVIGFLWTILFFKQPTQIRLVAGVLLLLVTCAWGFNMFTILNFAFPQYLYSSTWDKDSNPKDTSINLKVGFFNKYYFNHNPQPLADQTRLLQLDVLGITEISPADYELFKAQLPFQNSYYSPCRCKEEWGGEIALFSRYPLSNIQANTLANTPLLQTDISISNKLVNLVLVHPYAPTDDENLSQRNSSLHAIASLLSIYQSRQLILMGDFNTSSWSQSYKQFTDEVSWLRDSGRGYGLTSTWNTAFFHTMIDHLFISPSISLQQFHIVEDKLGSDHHMIWTELQV